MDFAVLLAQQAPPTGSAQETTVILGREVPFPPVLAVPAFLVGLCALAMLAEFIAVRLIQKLTARTNTKVDDAFAAGLPILFRPLFVLIALHVMVHAFLRDAAPPQELTPTGRLVSRALLVLTIVVMAVGVTTVAVRMVDAWVASKGHLRPIGAPLKLGIKIGMVPLALLTALEALNVQVTSFLTALGIGSLAVGLALQDTLKNMFAGVQIVLDQPIRAGDFVEVDKSVRGTVLEVGLRSTKIRNGENNLVIVPNNTIASAIVTNVDQGDPTCWKAFEVGVAYGTDTRRVQAILEDEANAAKALAGVADVPPRVTFRQFGDSALMFTVEVRLVNLSAGADVATEVQHRLYDRLRREGIEIPFPCRTLYVRREGGARPVTAG